MGPLHHSRADQLLGPGNPLPLSPLRLSWPLLRLPLLGPNPLQLLLQAPKSPCLPALHHLHPPPAAAAAAGQRGGRRPGLQWCHPNLPAVLICWTEQRMLTTARVCLCLLSAPTAAGAPGPCLERGWEGEGSDSGHVPANQLQRERDHECRWGWGGEKERTGERTGSKG